MSSVQWVQKTVILPATAENLTELHSQKPPKRPQKPLDARKRPTGLYYIIIVIFNLPSPVLPITKNPKLVPGEKTTVLIDEGRVWRAV